MSIRKLSCQQYRNINGVHFTHYTSDTNAFTEAKKYAKSNNLKVRTINNELYIENK